MGGAFHTPPSTPRPSPVPRRSPNTAWEQHVWVAADAPHDVWVLELLENADLPNRRAWDALVLSLQSNLLERNELPRHAVARLVHHTIRALADLLDLLVLLHCEGAPRRPSRRRAEKRSRTGAGRRREKGSSKVLSGESGPWAELGAKVSGRPAVAVLLLRLTSKASA